MLPFAALAPAFLAGEMPRLFSITTFAYLPFVYISGYPIIVGYVLVTVLVAYIMLRGAAELYESFASLKSIRTLSLSCLCKACEGPAVTLPLLKIR